MYDYHLVVKSSLEVLWTAAAYCEASHFPLAPPAVVAVCYEPSDLTPLVVVRHLFYFWLVSEENILKS